VLAQVSTRVPQELAGIPRLKLLQGGRGRDAPHSDSEWVRGGGGGGRTLEVELAVCRAPPQAYYVTPHWL
jgi:hypothetical protein